MATEIEFLIKRLQIVEGQLESPAAYDKDDRGRLHFRLQPSPVLAEELVHEAHLLKSLLADTIEGQVQQALAAWRSDWGREWKEYKELLRSLIDAHDDWARLPWPARNLMPEPPQLPALEIEDQKGLIWVIDERFFQVMDDLIERFAKWMNSEDE